jgi:transcriptional regulator with XRE-family HTH domain
LALDLSQAELADAVGMTVESISRAERGTITPTIWTLLAMARALETDLATLAGEPAEQRPSPSPKIERALRLMSKLPEEELDPILELIAVLEKKARSKPRSR